MSAGTMMKPPPTPMIAARKPTAAPSPRTGMTLTNSFEVRKRTLSGSRWIQLCWPGLRSCTVVPPRERRMALTLSTSIIAPTTPSSTT